MCAHYPDRAEAPGEVSLKSSSFNISCILNLSQWYTFIGLFISVQNILANARSYCLYSSRVYIASENIFVRNLPVTCGGVFVWHVVMFTERRGWFLIFWIFMPVEIKYLNNAQCFYQWHAAVFLYDVLSYLRKDAGDLQQLVIYVCTNKISEEPTVFLRLIGAGFRNKFLYIGYLRRFDISHFIHHVIFVSSLLICWLLMWMDPWNLYRRRIL